MVCIMLPQHFSPKQFQTCNINIVISTKVAVGQSILLGTKKRSQLVFQRRVTIGDYCICYMGKNAGLQVMENPYLTPRSLLSVPLKVSSVKVFMKNNYQAVFFNNQKC